MTESHGAPPLCNDPYRPDAMFRCRSGHGHFRRDRCATRRGRLECPLCLAGGIVDQLEYVESVLAKGGHR